MSEIRTKRQLTPADISGKRANAALGAVSAAEKARIEMGNQVPERKVPAALDPAVFDHRVGLSKGDEGDGVLERARDAYQVYRDKLAKWHDRERTIYSNQFERPEKLRMLTSQMVRDELTKGVELPTRAYHDCRSAIAEIDQEIDRTFRNRLKADESREIRDHVKSLSKKDRREFLKNADDDVIASVLSAKPFLSGLTDAEASLIRDQTNRRLFPDKLARKAKLERALELLDAGNGQYMNEASKMISKDLSKFEAQADAMAKAAAGQR